MKAGECGMKTSFILRQRYNVFLNNNFFLFSRLRYPRHRSCVSFAICFDPLALAAAALLVICHGERVSLNTTHSSAWHEHNRPDRFPDTSFHHSLPSFATLFCFTHFNTLISYDKRRVCTSETQNISSIRQCSSSSLTFNNIHFILFQLKCSLFIGIVKKSSFISLQCFLMLLSLSSNTRRVFKRRKKNVLRILLLPESFSLKLIMLIMLSVNPTTVQRGERDERRDFSALE